MNKSEPSAGHSACLDVSRISVKTYLAPPAPSGNSFSCCSSGPFLRTFQGVIWILKALSWVHSEGCRAGIVQSQGLSKLFFVRRKHLFWGRKTADCISMKSPGRGTGHTRAGRISAVLKSRRVGWPGVIQLVVCLPSFHSILVSTLTTA